MMREKEELKKVLVDAGVDLEKIWDQTLTLEKVKPKPNPGEG